MDYNKEKKRDNMMYIVIFFCSIICICFFYVGTGLFFSLNNNLSSYFLCYFSKEIPTYIISGITVFLVLKFIYFNLNKKISYKKLIKKTLLISIIPFCIVEFIENPKHVKIGNKYINRLNYQYKIMKDLIENKTTTITITNSNIEAKDTIPYQSTARGKNRKNYPEIDNCYVVYKESNTTQYGCSQAESSRVVSIINSLKRLESEITIEYYNNTGIIKAIDGISKTEYKKLKERVDYLRKQKNEQSQNENKEKEEYKYNYNETNTLIVQIE